MSPYATAAAIRVLQHGGDAVDGAVAAAAMRGVAEPFVAGPGGGGSMAVYRARVLARRRRERAGRAPGGSAAARAARVLVARR